MRWLLVSIAFSISASTVLGEGRVKLDLRPDGTPYDPTEYQGRPVDACLACHVDETDTLDIVGLRVLAQVPDEWPFLFEDEFDLDDDGIAGRMRFVSGEHGPAVARFGRALAASRFEDFAHIAAGVHDIDLTDDETMARVKAAFEARSPAPVDPFPNTASLQAFEARGCARCHVTREFESNGVRYRPLSDFLLHDLGDGPRRTKPLWGCPDCITAPGHGLTSR